MTVIFLDIETLPTDDASVIAEFEASIKAPSQYKKPDSIQQWMAENKESAVAELVAKTSLNGLYGSIACICFAIEDDAVQCFDRTTYPTEAAMLTDFYERIHYIAKLTYHGGETLNDLTFCGHNIAGFDLPFIKHRSIINGVKPCIPAAIAMNAKPWDKCIADTMLMWSADREKRVSMDKLCRAFGIDGKGDMDGSQVAEVWKTNPDKVIEYCMGDVERTRAIYKRLTFQG